jgi:hypothetical protein
MESARVPRSSASESNSKVKHFDFCEPADLFAGRSSLVSSQNSGRKLALFVCVDTASEGIQQRGYVRLTTPAEFTTKRMNYGLARTEKRWVRRLKAGLAPRPELGAATFFAVRLLDPPWSE